VTKGFGSGSFFQWLVSPLMKSNFSLSPASYSWQPFHPSATHCRRRNPHVQKFQYPFVQKLQKTPYFTAAKIPMFRNSNVHSCRTLELPTRLQPIAEEEIPVFSDSNVHSCKTLKSSLLDCNNPLQQKSPWLLWKNDIPMFIHSCRALESP